MGWEGVQTTSGSESFGRKRKVKFIDKIHQKMGIKRFHLVSGSPVEERRLKMQERKEPIVRTRSQGNWEENR